MRIFFIAALVTALAGVAFAFDCSQSEMGCDVSSPVKRDLVELPARDVAEMSNAELLRRNLPFKYPLLKRGAFA
jgi:hypothetical protein